MRVLRGVRVERGLKQRELSRKLKKAENYITKIETGERRCDVPEFFELCEAMGVDPIEIFTRVARWA
jgi:transcriptional regulator with XRE-family HTH domain